MESDRVKELFKRLAAAAGRNEEIDCLNDLAWELRELDPGRAQTLAEQALARSTESGQAFHLNGTAQALITLGEMALSSDAYGLALTRLLEAYTLLQGQCSPELLLSACHSIGWAHMRLGNFDEAVLYLNEALEISRNLKDPVKEAAILSSRGSLYSEQGYYSQALEALLRAAQLLENDRASRTKGIILNNLAYCQTMLEAGADALANSTAAIQIFRQLGLPVLEVGGLDTLAQVYIALSDLPKAEETLQGCLAIARRSKLEHSELVCLLSLARVYRQQNLLEAAKETCTRALQLAELFHSNTFLYKFHELLAEIYEVQDNLLTALQHYRQFHTAMDAAQSEAAEHRLENLKTLHQVEKKRKEAEMLALQNRALEKEIEDHRHTRAELEKLATTDSLTGLYNRWHLFTLGEYELEKCRLQKCTFALIMLDIDHFKLVNDQYGHSTGDQVLVEIANLIVENARKGDICCRYGGEEFVILLPDTGLENGHEAAERIRLAVCAARFLSGHKNIHITASLGVTCSKADDDSLNAVIGRADQALYQAKSAGRNLVS